MAMKAFWIGLATLAAGVQTATVRQEAASEPYILLSQDQDQQGRIKTLLRLGACDWASAHPALKDEAVVYVFAQGVQDVRGLGLSGR